MLFEFYDIYYLVLITSQSKLGSVVEIINIRTHSRKTNKLRNIYTIGRGARNISIKKWEIYYNFKIKIIRLQAKSYLKENFKPHLLRDVCTLCAGAFVSDSLLHMLL